MSYFRQVYGDVARTAHPGCERASGLPRAINHLAERADLPIEAAAATAPPTISATHVQAALELAVVQLYRRLRQNRFSFMDIDTLAALRTTHELYCQLTAQKLTLRFDRGAALVRVPPFSLQYRGSQRASSLTSKRKSAPAGATSAP